MNYIINQKGGNPMSSIKTSSQKTQGLTQGNGFTPDGVGSA